MNNNDNNDGGPAFPHNNLTIEAYQSGLAGPGMSLRDWFAGQALQGALASETSSYRWPFADGERASEDWKNIARFAYDAADAMIAARNR